MTREAVGTRLALAAALKTALRSTPLAKVTVAGLSRSAGVSRQTFYANFSNIYALAAWAFQTEVADRIMARAGYAEWVDGFGELLDYLRAYHDEAYAVLRSLRLAEVERFFYTQLRRMMAAIVTEVEGELRLRPADRDFVIDHYTLAVVGHLLHWLATDMREDPRVLVDNIEFVLRGSVIASLERFADRDRCPGPAAASTS